MPTPPVSRITAAALAVAGLLAATPASAAVALVVNAVADEADATPGDGACATAAGGCSLRAALQEVNATADGGTVTFAFVASTSLTFVTALPAVVKPLTLDGPDTVTVVLGRQLNTAAADGRVLLLAPGAGNLVTIRDLRLGGGNVVGSGGAIAVTSGSLTLINVAVVASAATESGGGLYFTGGGALELVGCYVESNLASGVPAATSLATGGGLHFAGSAGASLLVRESAFVANRAARAGGAVYVGGAAPAELRNTTLLQNSAGPNVAAWGGAVAADTAALSLRQVTVSGNGAGVAGGLGLRFGATAQLVNTVVAGNSGAIAAVEQDCQGSLAGSAGSFVGAAGAECTGVADAVDGNRVGTLVAPLAAKLTSPALLGSLAQAAMPPAINSPLRDAGDAAACALPALATDMVGVSRNPGTDGDADGTPGCDVGAVEAPAGGPPTITSFVADPATVDAGQGSALRWSVANADTCTLTPGPPISLPAEGSFDTGALSSTTTYTLECTGLPGSPAATGAVTVTVTALPPVAIASFSASPTTVAAGGSATLSWQVANATTCAIDDGDPYPPYPPTWSGSTGSAAVTVDATTTYTLTCQGPGGPVSITTTVTVACATAGPTITHFDLGGETGAVTMTSTWTLVFSWDATSATTCQLHRNGVDVPYGEGGAHVFESEVGSAGPPGLELWGLRCTDACGQQAESSTISVTVTAVPAGGSGGGGGGGGCSTPGSARLPLAALVLLVALGLVRARLRPDRAG